MKKFNKILNSFFGAIPAVSIATSAVVVSKLNNESKNIESSLGSSLSSFVENTYNSIDQIREHYLSKYEQNVLIDVKNHKANVSVENDSYQQSDRISYSQPSATLSFKYERVAFVDDNKFNENNFVEKLNDSSVNEWKYNVSSWWARAAQRYTGNIVIVPTWAPPVEIQHPAKEYNSIDSSYLNPEKEFLYSLYKENIMPNLSKKLQGVLPEFLLFLNKIGFFQNIMDSFYRKFPFLKLFKDKINDSIDKYYDKNKTKIHEQISVFLKNKIDKIMEKFSNHKLQEKTLKPILINNIDNKKINNIDFGIFKIKSAEINNLNFKSNNIMPITDYVSKEVCRGALCSHHTRSLVDVILTSGAQVIIENFFGNNPISWVLQNLSIVVLQLAKLEKILKVIEFLIKQNKDFNFIFDRFAKHFSRNSKRILFTYFGKVEKHGYSIGKCGNLISGIKIHSENNHVSIENDKPIIEFTGNPRILFNEKIDGYNLNVFYCISELSNYQKLYNYLLNEEFDNNIKNILLNNILNRTEPSRTIYKDFLDYKEKNIIPIKYKNELNSFQEFKNNGWIIPSDISTWNLLDDYVLPTIFTKNLFIYDEELQSKHYLYKDNKFSKINSKNIDSILMDNYFTEVLRF